MDKNRLKKVIQSALDISFSGITIENLSILDKNKFDEDTGKWIPDSYSLFMDITKNEFSGFSTERKVEILLEGLLGFECSVNFHYV